jgi:hypothetical protein
LASALVRTFWHKLSDTPNSLSKYPVGAGLAKLYQPLGKTTGAAIVTAAVCAVVFRKDRLVIFFIKPSNDFYTLIHSKIYTTLT